MTSCEMNLMDTKELLETLSALKKLGVKTATVGEVTVEFFPKHTRKSKMKPEDYKVLDDSERMPTEDEMLFYSTDEYDRLRAERKDALTNGDN